MQPIEQKVAEWCGGGYSRPAKPEDIKQAATFLGMSEEQMKLADDVVHQHGPGLAGEGFRLLANGVSLNVANHSLNMGRVFKGFGPQQPWQGVAGECDNVLHLSKLDPAFHQG